VADFGSNEGAYHSLKGRTHGRRFFVARPSSVAGGLVGVILALAVGSGLCASAGIVGEKRPLLYDLREPHGLEVLGFDLFYPQSTRSGATVVARRIVYRETDASKIDLQEVRDLSARIRSAGSRVKDHGLYISAPPFGGFHPQLLAVLVDDVLYNSLTAQFVGGGQGSPVDWKHYTQLSELLAEYGLLTVGLQGRPRTGHRNELLLSFPDDVNLFRLAQALEGRDEVEKLFLWRLVEGVVRSPRGQRGCTRSGASDGFTRDGAIFLKSISTVSDCANVSPATFVRIGEKGEVTELSAEEAAELGEFWLPPFDPPWPYGFKIE
jgi:hypothetical protein